MYKIEFTDGSYLNVTDSHPIADFYGNIKIASFTSPSKTDKILAELLGYQQLKTGDKLKSGHVVSKISKNPDREDIVYELVLEDSASHYANGISVLTFPKFLSYSLAFFAEDYRSECPFYVRKGVERLNKILTDEMLKKFHSKINEICKEYTDNFLIFKKEVDFIKHLNQQPHPEGLNLPHKVEHIAVVK